jgi:hypothetical protein
MLKLGSLTDESLIDDTSRYQLMLINGEWLYFISLFLQLETQHHNDNYPIPTKQQALLSTEAWLSDLTFKYKINITWHFTNFNNKLSTVVCSFC